MRFHSAIAHHSPAYISSLRRYNRVTYMVRPPASFLAAPPSDPSSFSLRRQACIALSNHLIASPSILSASSSILELGAGVGLLSLVAARIREGAAPTGGTAGGKIVATDVDERVLAMLEGNIKLSALFRLTFFPLFR